MNIVFTGYMASGKTTVGTLVAKMLGMSFADTDSLIEKSEKRSIAEIFAREGEEFFRNAESEIIKDIAKSDNTVISTGGGAVLRTENIDILRKNGIIVNLEPSEDVILSRLSGCDTTRPLANGSSAEEIIERFRARKPFYDNCDMKINMTADKSAEDAAKEIIMKLEANYI